MSVFNAYLDLSGKVDAEVLRDEKLAHRTSYRIGGPAALFVKANTYPALTRTFEVLQKEGVPWVVLGRGSNVLAADAGYAGCVVTLGREFCNVSVGEDGVLTAGAAARLSKLVSHTLASELTGLEFLVGIPGSVGGAVMMDAGTRKEWLGPRVRSVVTLKPGVGMRRYAGSDIEWGYRWCSLPSDEVVLEASFALDRGQKDRIAEDMNARLARRRDTQPMGVPCCGSIFRNPPHGSVGRYIEGCGLKGQAAGGAQISTLHGNFIVNRGGASASEVVALMSRMHDAVLEGYGVDLVPEVKLVGFDA